MKKMFKLFFYTLFILSCMLSCKNTKQLIHCSELQVVSGMTYYNDKPYNGKCRDTIDTKIYVKSFKNGLAHGEWLEFYDNGNIALKGSYKNDTINGEFISYHRNGTIKGRGSLNMGYRIGGWVYYDSLGVEIEKMFFDRNGNKIK